MNEPADRLVEVQEQASMESRAVSRLVHLLCLEILDLRDSVKDLRRPGILERLERLEALERREQLRGQEAWRKMAELSADQGFMAREARKVNEAHVTSMIQNLVRPIEVEPRDGKEME